MPARVVRAGRSIKDSYSSLREVWLSLFRHDTLWITGVLRRTDLNRHQARISGAVALDQLSLNVVTEERLIEQELAPGRQLVDTRPESAILRWISRGRGCITVDLGERSHAVSRAREYAERHQPHHHARTRTRIARVDPQFGAIPLLWDQQVGHGVHREAQLQRAAGYGGLD